MPDLKSGSLGTSKPNLRLGRPLGPRGAVSSGAGRQIPVLPSPAAALPQLRAPAFRRPPRHPPDAVARGPGALGQSWRPPSRGAARSPAAASLPPPLGARGRRLRHACRRAPRAELRVPGAPRQRARRACRAPPSRGRRPGSAPSPRPRAAPAGRSGLRGAAARGLRARGGGGAGAAPHRPAPGTRGWPAPRASGSPCREVSPGRPGSADGVLAAPGARGPGAASARGECGEARGRSRGRAGAAVRSRREPRGPTPGARRGAGSAGSGDPRGDPGERLGLLSGAAWRWGPGAVRDREGKRARCAGGGENGRGASALVWGLPAGAEARTPGAPGVLELPGPWAAATVRSPGRRQPRRGEGSGRPAWGPKFRSRFPRYGLCLFVRPLHAAERETDHRWSWALF